jgi:hypothetical protein
MTDLLDWLAIFGIFFAVSFVSLLAICGLVWVCFKPQERGPRRIVDIHNRGHTRIMMPDGSIK